MYFFSLYERDDGGSVDRIPLGDRPKSITFKEDGKSSLTERFYSCERIGKNNYIQHGFENLAQKLKDSDREEVLLYCHGFNNYPEDDIFPNAKRLQQLCDAHLNNRIEVIPVIWPCKDKIGVVRDYFSDQKVADRAGTAISRSLNYFFDWQVDNQKKGIKSAPCLKKISILAHSMGNRVLVGGLDEFSEAVSGRIPLFKNIFMVAADVTNEVLERRNKGRHIPAMAQNVVVYFAYDDAVMPLSKAANTINGEFSRRLGLSGPERWKKKHLASNVFAVNCTEYNNKYDFKGHAYFMEKPSSDSNGTLKAGKVFKHIAEVLKLGFFHEDGKITEKRKIIL